MSVQASIWAWQQDIKATDKLFLLFLADNVGSSDTIRTTYDNIRAATNMDKGTLAKSVRRLESKGLISRTIRPGFTPEYKVLGAET